MPSLDRLMFTEVSILIAGMLITVVGCMYMPLRAQSTFLNIENPSAIESVNFTTFFVSSVFSLWSLSTFSIWSSNWCLILISSLSHSRS